jgi:hypothetical protein
MMKFQCRLLAHGVNLLEELIVFQPRKHKQRMGLGVFGAMSRHDIEFKPIWLGSLFYLRLALLESIFCSYSGFVGGVAEWLNAPVLKTF